MYSINVIPLKGFNNLEFGMDRETVRRVLGSFTEFRKTEFDENTTDDFGFCHIYYDNNNCFEAVEFFDDVEVFLEDVRIFPVKFSEMIDRIPFLEKDEDGAISYPLSIAVYAPYKEVESIMFAQIGYFDFLEA